MDQQQPFNTSADWAYREQCGCVVTFLGSCQHNSTWMEPCQFHNKRYQFHDRETIVLRARAAREQAQLNQPPKDA